MNLCRTDKMLMNLRVALSHALEGKLPLTEEQYERVVEAAKYSKPIDIANALKQIEGMNAMLIDEEDCLDKEFLSGDKWFAEGVQSCNSCAILWNSESEDIISVVFYDKEFSFYVIEYADVNDVPIELIVKDPSKSLTMCICDTFQLIGRYNKGLLIQG